MKKDDDFRFMLVREDVLPEAMMKTLEAKELLDRKKASSVWEAVKQVDLSRSAFYKYRDTVFPFHHMVKERIITLFFHIEDRSGTLSQLLAVISEYACNILTIHQTIPIQGRANVTISLNVTKINTTLEALMTRLRQFPFVEKVEILSSGA